MFALVSHAQDKSASRICTLTYVRVGQTHHMEIFFLFKSDAFGTARPYRSHHILHIRTQSAYLHVLFLIDFRMEFDLIDLCRKAHEPAEQVHDLNVILL